MERAEREVKFFAFKERFSWALIELPTEKILLEALIRIFSPASVLIMDVEIEVVVELFLLPLDLLECK